MAFKVSPFHKQMNGTPFQVKSPLHKAVSYDAAYDAQSEEKKKTQTREEFKKAAKEYNTKKYGTTEPTRDSKKAGKTKEELASEVKAKNEKKEDPKPAPKPAEETKKPEPKVKTRKQLRAEKRVGRLEKKRKKKGSLTEAQQKRLNRNESKSKGEEVKDKDKTKAGKIIKKGVDKAKNVVKKKKDDNSMSDSDRAAKRQASGKYNADGSPKSAEERNSALAAKSPLNDLQSTYRKVKAKVGGKIRRLLGEPEPTPIKPKKDSAVKKIDSGEISTGKKTRKELNQM